MGSYTEPSPQEKLPWIETPLIESKALSKAAGCNILLKLELLQPAYSFKSRGIGHLILCAIERHPPGTPLHFFSSSGGNAGLAAVTAARSLGYPATVVVPVSTDQMMIERIQTAGASAVLQFGASWKEADNHLRETVMPQAGLDGGAVSVYVPPFDHPDIWEGAATMVEEIAKQMDGDKPDAIVCSVGGGGLFAGVIRGLEKVGWGEDVRVLAMETLGADSLHKSLQAGELITLPGITSVAKSLGAVRVAERAFEYAQKRNVTSAVLSDAEACMGCWRLADDQRLIVEPACGVSIAPCYNGMLTKVLPGLTAESKVVIVVCGGSVTTVEKLIEYRQKFGAGEGDL